MKQISSAGDSVLGRVNDRVCKRVNDHANSRAPDSVYSHVHSHVLLIVVANSHAIATAWNIVGDL